MADDIKDLLFLKQEAQPAATETVKAEIPPVEVSATEVNTREATSETPKVEVTQTELPEYLKKVSEYSGREFKSDDELKTFFEQYDIISKEHSDLKGATEKNKVIEEFIREKGKLYDPVAMFGGKDNYRKLQIATELAKSGDRTMAMELVSSDLDKVHDLDLMGKFAQYKTPGLDGGLKGGIEAYLESIGVNTDDIEDWNTAKELFEKLPSKKRSVVQLKAAELRDSLKKSIQSVNVPDAENPITEIISKYDEQTKNIEALQGQWNQKEVMTQITDSLKKLPLPKYGFDFEIKEDVSQIVNDYLASAARRGVQPDEAGRLKVLKAIQEEIFSRNRYQIIDAIVSHKEAEIRAELQKKYENKTPISTPQAPKLDDAAKAANAQWRKVVGV